jgi:hypothetical protein
VEVGVSFRSRRESLGDHALLEGAVDVTTSSINTSSNGFFTREETPVLAPTAQSESRETIVSPQMAWPQIYFAATGTLLMFSLGVAKYLRENYNLVSTKVLTVSGGGIAGVALLTLQPGEFDQVADQIASIFAPLHSNPFANLLVGKKYRQVLELLVTEGHLPLLRNKLAVATTTLPLRRQKVYTQPFRTVDEVIGYLQTSAYIPFYFLRPPYLHHLLEIDGGASPTVFDPKTTLVVGAGYSPEADVYLTKERMDSLVFRSYAEQMSLYRAGYQRAKELLG